MTPEKFENTFILPLQGQESILKQNEMKKRILAFMYTLRKL